MASVFPDYLSTAALSWACIQDYAVQRLSGQSDAFYALSLMFVADCLEAQITQKTRFTNTLTESAWARSPDGNYIEPIFSAGEGETHSHWLEIAPDQVPPHMKVQHIFSTASLHRTIAAANEMSPIQWKQMVHALPLCLEAMKCSMIGVDPALEIHRYRYFVALPNETLECPDFQANRHARPLTADEPRGQVIQVNFGLR
jgi:hypothetical protein